MCVKQTTKCIQIKYQLQVFSTLSFCLNWFQMAQQQQQQHFEENFEDLTLEAETRMDVQVEYPLGISTDPRHQTTAQTRTLLQKIEAEDAFIRDVCNYIYGARNNNL